MGDVHKKIVSILKVIKYESNLLGDDVTGDVTSDGNDVTSNGNDVNGDVTGVSNNATDNLNGMESDQNTITDNYTSNANTHGTDNYNYTNNTNTHSPVNTNNCNCNYIYNKNIEGSKGSLIFFTGDFKYAIKVITDEEKKVFLKNRAAIEEYMKRNEQTFLPKYEKLFEINGENVMVIKNIFKRCHEEVYDLKGIGVQRKCRKMKTERNWKNKNLVVKDPEGTIKQLRKDAEFLESLGLMDYSLVIGKAKETNEKGENDKETGKSENEKETEKENGKSENENEKENGKSEKIVDQKRDKDINNDWVMFENDVIDDVNIKTVKTTKVSEMNSEDNLSIGLTDTLTEYTATKKLEKFFYFFLCCPNVSSTNPRRYRTRFNEMIEKIFI